MSDIATNKAARTQHQYEIINQSTRLDRATSQRNTRLIKFWDLNSAMSIRPSHLHSTISILRNHFCRSTELLRLLSFPPPRGRIPLYTSRGCRRPDVRSPFLFLLYCARPPYWDPLQPILGWSRPLELYWSTHQLSNWPIYRNWSMHQVFHQLYYVQ